MFLNVKRSLHRSQTKAKAAPAMLPSRHEKQQ